MQRFDAVIIGAGAAGLTLAAHLAASSWREHSVLLVDDGEHPVDERAWAFWSRRHSLLDVAVSSSWARIAVTAGARHLDLDLEPYSYRLVRGPDLTRRVVELTAAGHGSARVTAQVRDVCDDRRLARVTGECLDVEAAWVFDSRPPPGPAPGEPRLRFLGWEIEAPGPVFDPEVATFMDFRAHAPGHVRFCYLLPTTPGRALVELASFGVTDPLPGELAAQLEAYLRDVVRLDSWQLVRCEAGTLPLRPAGRRRLGHRVLGIGRAGGMLKASTGFAFDRIVRDAETITSSLVHHGHPFEMTAQHRRHRFLDRVLLEVVRRQPQAIEPAFARMFERNPPSRVLRFLDEDTSLAEEARLVATLPPRPFIRAALRLAVRR